MSHYRSDLRQTVPLFRHFQHHKDADKKPTALLKGHNAKGETDDELERRQKFPVLLLRFFFFLASVDDGNNVQHVIKHLNLICKCRFICPLTEISTQTYCMLVG